MIDAEVLQNLTRDDVLDLIVDFPITPLRNKLIITLNIYDEEADPELQGGLDEVQYVLAAGSHSKADLPPGTKLILDIGRMTQGTMDDGEGNIVPKIAVKMIMIDDRPFGIIPDVYVDAVDNRL